MRPRRGARRARSGRGTSPRPTGCRRRRRRAALGRGLLQGLAEGPGDLLGGGGCLGLAEKRADRRGGSLVRGHEIELLQHLHDRPVGDPLAVGEAASADDRRLARGQASATSRDLPTPASPTSVTISQRRSACARCQASRTIASSRSRPTNRASCRRSGESRTRKQPVRGNRLRLPLQLERLDRLDLDRLANERERRRSPISTSPGWAACSSRAATFTASPVASRSSVPVTTSPVMTPIRP